MQTAIELEERELLLKRLRHRSRQRGFAEADELFMAFARDHMDVLTDSQLQAYDALLNVADWDAFYWLVGQNDAPPEFLEIIALMQLSTLKLRQS